MYIGSRGPVVVVPESAGDARKIKDHTAAAVALSRIYILLSLLLLHIVRPFPMRIIHETYGIQGVQNARRRGNALEFRATSADNGRHANKGHRTNRVPGLGRVVCHSINLEYI